VEATEQGKETTARNKNARNIEYNKIQ